MFLFVVYQRDTYLILNKCSGIISYDRFVPINYYHRLFDTNFWFSLN